MKRIIAVVVMLAFTGMAVFAAPGSAAAVQEDGNTAVVSAGNQGVLDGADDLFADVQATELTTEEAQAVEGGIIIPIIIAIVVVTVIVASPSHAR